MSTAHAYSAAKAGVNNLTRSMAVTYGKHGIRANAIAAGTIETKMVSSFFNDDFQAQKVSKYPLQRMAKPHEIASAALFLASEEASYITGAVIPVDGGRMAGTGA